MQYRTLLSVGLTAGLLGLFSCSPGDGDASSTTAQNEDWSDGPLRILSFTPEVALTTGTTNMLIRGEGFTPDTTVLFGDTPSPQVSYINEDMITALIPSHAQGEVDLIVQDATNQVRVYKGFLFYPVIPDDGTDSDGDGLTDVQESIIGFPIRVDFLGLGLNSEHLLPFSVTSDPLLTDTDGDGLSDAEEVFAKSNPREVDTDFDGLWDYEEAKRWLTSPISVDTDGDARDADGSSVLSTLPPVFDLFDGAELYTYDQLILPPSQRGDIKLNATSPTLDDTDGDNVRDFDEIDTPVRTPLFADMPQLVFEIVDDLDVRLDVEYAEEEGTTTAYETSYSTSLSESTATSRSHSVSSSLTFGGEAGFEFSPFSFGSGSAHWEITSGYESSWGTEKEVGSETETAFSQLEERSRTLTETASTGSIVTGIEIRNEGNITVQVLDLGHTIRQWVANDSADMSDLTQGEFRTVGVLSPDLGPGLTLAPGGSSGVIPITAEEVNADRIKDLLAQPDSLQLEPEAFELVNAEGFNYAFIEEITGARTGRVTIDYGNGEFEEYRIATNVARNDDGSYAGITMDRVMDLIVGPDGWEMNTVEDLCNELEVDDVLWRIRDVEGINSGDQRAFWTVVVSDEDELVQKPFDEYVLRNGETILLAMIQDLDGDGIIAPIEQHYGSSDLLADTDGDGINDPEEAVRNYFEQCQTKRGGWTVTVTAADGVTTTSERVYSDPSVADSDGDGLTDGQERFGWCECQDMPGDPSAKPEILNQTDCEAQSGTWHETGTNPGSVDTDGDGVLDPVDPTPLLQGGRLYVLDGSAGSGTSWSDAYGDIEDAMAAARTANGDTDLTNDVVEVWVSEGVYELAEEELVDGLTLYGGFAGTETALGQRNPDGLTNGSELQQRTSTLPILVTGDDPVTSTLDGFALIGSEARAMELSGNSSTTVTVRNCFFRDNSTTGSGGALSSVSINLELVDCVFFGNEATTSGGALTIVGGDFSVSGCIFDSNRVVLGGNLPFTSGGGLSLRGSVDAIFEDTVFRGNSIYNDQTIDSSIYRMQGGGVIVETTCEVTFDRCEFESNVVEKTQDFESISWSLDFSGGGLCVNDGSEVNVLNCLFVGNEAYHFGAGISVLDDSQVNVLNSTFVGNLNLIYNTEANQYELCDSDIFIEPYALGAAIGSAAETTVANCAFFGNGPADGDTLIKYDTATGNFTFELNILNTIASPFGLLAPGCAGEDGSLSFFNCALENSTFAVLPVPGLFEGTGNIETSDLGFVGSNNYQPGSGSILIDTGSAFFDADILQTGFQSLPEFDRDGNPRLIDGDGDGETRVDIGAFEYQN